MELNEFVQNFAVQFEESDPARFSKDTKFREVEGWSSIRALFIIGMVDEIYQVKIKADDIKQSQTIEDLFEIVKRRV